MITTLRSAWSWFAISALAVAWVPLMLVVYLFDRDPAKYRTGWWFRRLGYMMVAATPWRVQITGNMPENPRLPYMVIANHQSLADIPVFSRLPWDMKWVGKKSLFSIPVIGPMMHASRDIPLDRGDRRARASVLFEMKDRLSKNVSVMVMPEGTRSKDGRVGPFSDGAFAIAIKAGTPVLPIAVDGTFDALPKDTWKFGPARTIRLHVFDAVPVEGKEVAPLREHVRDLIVAKVAAWRGVTLADVDRLAERTDAQSSAT